MDWTAIPLVPCLPRGCLRCGASEFSVLSLKFEELERGGIKFYYFDLASHHRNAAGFALVIAVCACLTSEHFSHLILELGYTQYGNIRLWSSSKCSRAASNSGAAAMSKALAWSSADTNSSSFSMPLAVQQIVCVSDSMTNASWSFNDKPATFHGAGVCVAFISVSFLSMGVIELRRAQGF